MSSVRWSWCAEAASLVAGAAMVSGNEPNSRMSDWARILLEPRIVASKSTTVLDYLRAAMAFGDREQFRILFLDKRNVLIADEVQQVGTVDHVPVYPREVMRRALELRAAAVLLVHNHPSGNPTPSHADIQITQAIIDAGKVFGICVHDHIIVGKEGHSSFKSLRLI